MSPSLLLLHPQHWEDGFAEHYLCRLFGTCLTALPGMIWGQELPSDPLWLLLEISSLEEAGHSNCSFLSEKQIFPLACGHANKYTSALMGCVTGGPLLMSLEDLGLAPAACLHACPMEHR